MHGLRGWILGLGLALAAGAATPRLPRCAAPPKLARGLAARCWQTAWKVPGWVQVAPQPGAAPVAPVTAWVAYAARHLYAAFRVTEPAAEQRGSPRKRDDLTGADYVELAVDPTHSGQQFYVFQVTPWGVQADGTYTSQTRAVDYGWDADWRARAWRDAAGYTVVLSIPLNALPGHGAGLPTWGLQWVCYRLARRETDVAPPMGRGDWTYGRLGRTQLLEVPVGGAARSAWIQPYFTGQALGRPGQPGLTQGRLGADAEVAVTPTLTLDATINPDFSEVETDVPQVGINRLQPNFYPEKRPFFTQGNTYFQSSAVPFIAPTTGTALGGIFYSRRVVNPAWGAKLTGEAGPWQIGALVLRDRGLPGIAAAANDAVLRLRHRLGGASSWGMIGTLRDGVGSQNGVLGADADLHLLPGVDWQLGAYASDTNGLNLTAQQVENVGAGSVQPNTRHSSGAFLTSTLNASTRTDTLVLNLYAVSPNFDPQLAYQPRTNDKSYFLWYARTWWTPRAGGNALQRFARRLRLQRVALATNEIGDTTFNSGGADDLEDVELGLYWPANTTSWLYPNISHQDWDGRRYDTSQWIWNVNSQLWPALQPTLLWTWGRTVDLAADRPATEDDLQFTLTGAVGHVLVTAQAEQYQLWDQPAHNQVANDLVWSWRTEYQITPATYFRLMLLGDSGAHSMQYNLLLRRELNPGEEFYIGYGADYLRSLVSQPLPFGTSPSLALQQRALFFKLSRRLNVRLR